MRSAQKIENNLQKRLMQEIMNFVSEIVGTMRGIGFIKHTMQTMKMNNFGMQPS